MHLQTPCCVHYDGIIVLGFGLRQALLGNIRRPCVYAHLKHRHLHSHATLEELGISMKPFLYKARMCCRSLKCRKSGSYCGCHEQSLQVHVFS